MRNVDTQNKQINSMKPQMKMRCYKVRRILRYHKPNKALYPEKYAHNLFLLFYPFRDEKEFLSGCPPMYQNKRLEPGVQTVINNNRIKFEPYVDEAYSRYDANMLENQNPFGQIENDETREAVYFNDQKMKIKSQTETLQFQILCQGS